MKSENFSDFSIFLFQPQFSIILSFSADILRIGHNDKVFIFV